MEQLFQSVGVKSLSSLLPWAILSGLVLAALAPAIHRLAGRATGWILALLPVALTFYFGAFVGAVSSGESFSLGYAWVPALHVNLTITLDGLSLLFALLVNGVGALILVYAGAYLAGNPFLGRFYAFLLLFMASMLGLVLAANLLALFVFWELTSLSSYFLIGFDNKRAQARASALQALLVTGGGGLALMAGLILLGQAGGSFEIPTLLARSEQIVSHSLYAPALVLILLGAFTKSAQFPFHFWLPGAMEAPTPVSAYLHSATMVKAGIYLLARLSPALGGSELWVWCVACVGGITMLLGAWLALLQSDLKRILAYSTISSLGLLTMLLGLGGEAAVTAAMAFLLGHALYKGALFQVAGALDHATGTRDVDRLSGLGRVMPITAVAACIAALSMAGLPPLFGFIAKELSYEASLHASASGWITTAAVAANVLLVAAAAVVGIRPFVGKPLPTPEQAHEVPLGLWLGPIILSALSFGLGIWPGLGADQLVVSASSSVLARELDSHLALWHGLNMAFGLSVVTVALGVGAYAVRGQLRGWKASWGDQLHFGPSAWYEWALATMNGLAQGQTRLLQSGYLRYYLIITVGAATALAGYSLLGRGGLNLTFNWPDLRFYEAGLAGLMLLGILSAVVAKSRLAAITSLGVVGYGMALVFVMFGAPDLAMTQFLIETLTVILFVLVFYHLPESQIKSGLLSRTRDAILAIATAGVMTVFVLLAAPEYQPSISEFFAQNSVSGGHGRNIVNVILVDFRGLDTMGEITVLSIAAVGVYGLLKLRRKTDEPVRESSAQPAVSLASAEGEDHQVPGTATSLILRTATRLLLPTLLLYSVFLLLRGHNQPGGGFSGGLIAASAFILYGIAYGARAARKALPENLQALIGSGLIVALSSGALALFAGLPLMTGLWGKFYLPGLGRLDVGTPLIFDVGVYLAVIGVTLSIILPLAEE